MIQSCQDILQRINDSARAWANRHDVGRRYNALKQKYAGLHSAQLAAGRTIERVEDHSGEVVLFFTGGGYLYLTPHGCDEPYIDCDDLDSGWLRYYELLTPEDEAELDDLERQQFLASRQQWARNQLADIVRELGADAVKELLG